MLTHYSCRVPLFRPCGACGRGAPGCTAVRQQDSPCFLCARQQPAVNTAEHAKQAATIPVLVVINPHTHCISAFLFFHSCTARVVALHQERTCGASGVRREKCLFPFRILEGRQPFPHDSRAMFFAVRRQQQPATRRFCRVDDPERTRLG